MICRAPIGDFRQPPDSGNRAPYPSTFIQCVDSTEPMIHGLWFHGINGLCREVHSTVRIEIPSGTIKKFIAEYLSANGWHNRIIGEISINNSVQFFGLSEIWGSELLYVANSRAQ